MEHKQGGISIFLAIVFLTLVAFSCSIVEITRYQIAMIQAERALLSSSQSVLGGYDHILKNEYGIFARDTNYSDLHYINGHDMISDINRSPMANDLTYYLEGNIHNDPNLTDKSLLEEYISVKHPSPYKLIPLELEDMKVIGGHQLISHEGLDYVKRDMMAFMELRAPLLLIEPFLEKVMVIEKLGKTTTFIQAKDNIIKETRNIEEAYLNLYRWIEGIDINPSSGRIKVVDDNFVKIILPKVKVQAPEISFIKVNEIETNLEKKEIDISRLASSFDAAYIQFKALVIELQGSQDKHADLVVRRDKVRDQIRSLRAKLGSGEQDPDRAASIKKEISNKQRRVKEISSQIKAVVDLKEKQVTELTIIFGTMDEKMKHFGGLTLGADSVLGMNRKARDEIEWIKEKGKILDQEIDTFVHRETQNQEDYIVRTFDHAMEELETIKTSYGADMRKDNFDTLGNLTYMHERLVENIQLLEKQEPIIQKIISDYPAMIAGCFKDAGLSKQALMILNKGQIYGPLKVGMEHYKTKTMGYPTMKRDIQNVCNLVSTYYRKDLYFDYSDYGLDGQANMNGTLVDGKGFFDNVKSNVSDLDVRNLFEAVLPTEYLFDDTLPSAIMPSDNDKVQEEDQVSEETGLTALDGKLFSNLIHIGSGCKEQLLLNEYAIGMFTSMTGKYGEDQEALTLSGYQKKNHILDSELEYIITGKTDQLEAVTTISSKIVAMRIALNTIHLVTDPSKRTIIMNLANAVAGWWSLGALALAIALIIGLLWATAESLVDLVMLLQGRKVPLLKTKTSWFLGPENLTSNIIERGSEIAIQKTQDTLNGLQDKTQEWVAGLKDALSEDVNGLLEEQIQVMQMEGIQMADAMAQSYEDDLLRRMDAILLSYNEGTNVYDGSMSDYPRTDSRYEILETFKQDVASGTRNKEITHSLLSEIKRDLQAAYTKKIEIHKEKIIQEASEVTGQGLDLLELTVNQKIEALGKKGEQISADFIIEKTAQIKKSTSNKLLEKNPAVDTKVKGEQLTEFIPAASYEDYLRFFMLMDWKALDDRVLRMLDVIEINIKTARGNESWTLGDYVFGIDIRATFKVRYGFINIMPAMQERKSRFKGYHRLAVEVGNAYE
ncbi:DUF5702 domain-containing protein [Petrocella sp. FN5]|uniref:DUF5702 domain-containing protein n=1 Tax=Petrocella sp. FN5 TaxID=3032002 RepID=UPI0023DC5317|nr:DUF5702 domain-containing protein [Petrocella sp. FN5]MDF1618376.1 DUF5702 domain-containing protein [Petrocella sp. FN5]